MTSCSRRFTPVFQSVQAAENGREEAKNRTQFNLWPFIRLRAMTKWAPLSGLPRGVDLCNAANALADNEMSELKNSLNNCPEVGLAKTEGIGYRHRASLV